MKWFRFYSEARNDNKLRALTAAQKWVWLCLLCYASEQDERGIIRDIDRELLAVECADGDVELLEATLTRLVKLRILLIDEGGDILFINFLERQYDKPSDAPERVAERKSRMKQQGQSAEERGQNAQERAGTRVERGQNAQERLYSDSDTENTQRIQDSPPSPPPEAQPVPKPQGSQVAVIEFAENFRDKHGGEGPHVPDKAAKALVALRLDLGQEKYRQALTGFFEDDWASENGHSAAIFVASSMDRWRHTKPPAKNGTRGSPVPDHADQSAIQLRGITALTRGNTT